MGISETLWEGSGNGNANADGRNLYGNDSKEGGRGWPCRPEVSQCGGDTI